MSARTIAIGDIHGCSTALLALLEAIGPCSDDRLVQLGDAIDRGPNTRRVIDELVALSQTCTVIVLLGDHEEMLLSAIHDAAQFDRWLRNGGRETLMSYGWEPSSTLPYPEFLIPASHLCFLRNLQAFFETDAHIFVHAGYVPELQMLDQPGIALRWRVCHRDLRAPHCSGKTVIAGHSAQRSGEVLDLGFMKCIDTNCVRGGWLTALDTASGRIWQTNNFGQIRKL